MSEIDCHPKLPNMFICQITSKNESDLNIVYCMLVKINTVCLLPVPESNSALAF